MKAILVMAVLAAGTFQAQQPSAPVMAGPAPFHWHDDYTEYHLLGPGTNQFHIVYLLNQRQAGLTYVLNQTRSGSAGSDISVSDPRTGAPLTFDYMTGRELADAGVPGRLAPDEHYIRAHLPRPVPAAGEGRVRIEKTYTDEKSYVASGETITFARSLGIGRNAIVLPAGYGLVSSNVAAEISTLADGRIQLSFENINGYASDVSIRAARRASPARTPSPRAASHASESAKTLYELRDDGQVFVMHARVFRSVREDGALSSVPLGAFSQIPGVRALDMDTGEALAVAPPAGRAHFASATLVPRAGERIRSAQVRFYGAYRDPKYVLRASALEWSRRIGEPRATVVLPAGFELTHASMPVTTGTLPDGRVYLQAVNNRAGSILTLQLRAAKIAG